MDGQRVGTPWHLWVVGVLSLIWNGFGAWDYLQTQRVNREYITAMTEPMGIAVDDAIAYFARFPAWMDAAWALGVWFAVLGSILLLLRMRWALPAFIVSFFGLFVTTMYGIAEPMPGLADQTMSIGFSAVLWIVAIALIIYARRMVARDFVRSEADGSGQLEDLAFCRINRR